MRNPPRQAVRCAAGCAPVTRYPALFIEMRRLSRGHYEMNLVPMTEPGEVLAPGEFTERS